MIITLSDSTAQAGLVTAELDQHRAMGIKTFLGVYVGPDSQYKQDLFLLLSGNNTERIFKYSSFSNFESGIREIAAAACDDDIGAGTTEVSVELS